MAATNTMIERLQEIKRIKLCLKCQKKLEAMSVGGGNLDLFGLGNQIYYCKNEKCKRWGVLVVSYSWVGEDKK